MKDERHSVGTQYVDNLTTAERSINNSRRLDRTEKVVEIIGEVVNPTSNVFADGSSVSTQATRAEDIISDEDIRLQGEINSKVSQSEYDEEQATQNTNIAANTSDVEALQISQAEQDVLIAEKADLTYVDAELAKKVDQTVFDISQSNQNDEISNLEIRVTNNEAGIAGNDEELLDHESRIETLEVNNTVQDTDIDNLQANDVIQDADIDALQADVVRIDAEQITQNERLDSVEAKDIQQDNRLETIEGLLASVSKDSSVITPQDSLSPVDSTPRVVKATINKDFIEGSVATGGNEVTGEYTITANTDLILDIDYRFLAEKVVGEPVRFTVELYNFTKSRVEDSSENIINFAGSTNFEVVGIPLFSDGIEAGDVCIFRVYTDGANTVSVTEAKALIRAEQKSGTSEVIYDYNVQSTSDVGGATVLADMNILNSTKADITYVDAENAAQDAIIAGLPSQSDLDNLETNIQAQLDTKADELDIWDSAGNVKLGNRSWSPVFTTGSNGQPDIVNTAGLHMLRWINGGVEFGDATAAGPFIFQANREANFKIKGKNPLQVRDTGLWINSLSNQSGSLTSIYNVFASKSAETDLSNIQSDISNLQTTKADITYVDAETTFLSGEKVKDVDLSTLGGSGGSYEWISETVDTDNINNSTFNLTNPGTPGVSALKIEGNNVIFNDANVVRMFGTDVVMSNSNISKNGANEEYQNGQILYDSTIYIQGNQVSGLLFKTGELKNEYRLFIGDKLYYSPDGTGTGLVDIDTHILNVVAAKREEMKAELKEELIRELRNEIIN